MGGTPPPATLKYNPCVEVKLNIPISLENLSTLAFSSKMFSDENVLKPETKFIRILNAVIFGW